MRNGTTDGGTSRLAGPTGREARSGSALLIALWVVLLVSLIIGPFAFDMHVETRLASYMRKQTKAEYLAKAGMERAKMVVAKSIDPHIKDETYEHKAEVWFDNAYRLAYGKPVTIVDSLETGTIGLEIMPEPALRNIYHLSNADWEHVLEVAGAPKEQWRELIDSFRDWKDEGNDPLPYGAETDDYYATLNPPMRAKNAPLFTISELLLVKGFSSTTGLVGRLEGMLTIYGDKTVNVNSASRDVLMTLDGVTEQIAQDIVDERQGYADDDEKEDTDRSFKSPEDFISRLGALGLAVPGSLRGSISTSSRIYKIKSTGKSGNATRTIVCIASVGANGMLRVLEWKESE